MCVDHCAGQRLVPQRLLNQSHIHLPNQMACARVFEDVNEPAILLQSCIFRVSLKDPEYLRSGKPAAFL
jgi:hypothetical protein